MKGLQRKYHESITGCDYLAIRDGFCDQLIRSLKGETSSLPFIRNVLPRSPLVQIGEKFQVFVIGGTNAEIATVRFDAAGAITILEYESRSELAKFKTVDDLLDFIDAHVDDATKAISLNFGFALVPVNGAKGKLDGVMVGNDTKDHSFQGLLQQRVGAAIESHFHSRHGHDLIASVGNDVVCLAASAVSRDVNRDTLLAGIVGTGYNTAFFLDERTIVNVQACDFVNLMSPVTGVSLGGVSADISEQLYKTEVSGGELYKRYNSLVDRYALAGKIRSSKDLAVLATADMAEEGDIARALFRRSASLVAAQFAGMYNFKKRPTRLLAIMQGGIFWDVPGYKEMVKTALERLGVPSGTIVFKRLEHADILGAAKLLIGGL